MRGENHLRDTFGTRPANQPERALPVLCTIIDRRQIMAMYIYHPSYLSVLRLSGYRGQPE